MQTLLIAATLLFFQDEAEYNLLMGEMRFIVGNFREPEDGAVMRPASYWERAVRISRDIEKFQPTSTRELYAAQQLFSGMLSLTEGNTAEAIAEFRHGLRLEPNEAPMFHYALGLCASADRQTGVAESEFKLAFEGAPHWAAPRMALAGIYLDSGRAREAESLLKSSMDLNLTDVDAIRSRQYFLLAKILDAQGRPKDAAGALRTAIELDTRNPMMTDYLGMLLLKMGERPQALEVWKNAAVVFRQDPALTREIALVESGLPVTAASGFTGPVKASLTAASPRLPGGSPYRAYRIRAVAGNVLRLRADSTAFLPFLILLGPDGKAVAMQEIRSSYFSVLEYRVNTPGNYHVIMCSYLPGQTGEFDLSIPK